MSIMPAYFTTTSFKKRKVKKMTKAKQQALVEFNRERKKMGLDPIDTMITSKRSKELRVVVNPVTVNRPYVDPARLRKYGSLPFTGDACYRKEDKVYTGDKMKGIGTLHKSNAVPVFTDQEAIDIARMRR